jgi:hypothetical protein
MHSYKKQHRETKVYLYQATKQKPHVGGKYNTWWRHPMDILKTKPSKHLFQKQIYICLTNNQVKLSKLCHS